MLRDPILMCMQMLNKLLNEKGKVTVADEEVFLSQVNFLVNYHALEEGRRIILENRVEMLPDLFEVFAQALIEKECTTHLKLLLLSGLTRWPSTLKKERREMKKNLLERFPIPQKCAGHKPLAITFSAVLRHVQKEVERHYSVE